MDWDIPACHPGYQMQPSLPPVSPLILSSRICPPLPPPPTQGPSKHCQDFFLQNPLSHTSPCSQYSSIPHSDSLLDEHEWVPSLSSFQFGHSYGSIHVLKQEIYLGSWGYKRLMHSFCLIPFPIPHPWASLLFLPLINLHFISLTVSWPQSVMWRQHWGKWVCEYICSYQYILRGHGHSCSLVTNDEMSGADTSLVKDGERSSMASWQESGKLLQANWI